jgi:hypothetical protein
VASAELWECSSTFLRTEDTYGSPKRRTIQRRGNKRLVLKNIGHHKSFSGNSEPHINFKIQHSLNNIKILHKIIQQTLESQNKTIYYIQYIIYNILYIIYYICKTSDSTANNYMFRPLTGHHQVVHPMKRGWWLYNIQCNIVQPSTIFIGCTTWSWPVRGRNM